MRRLTAIALAAGLLSASAVLAKPAKNDTVYIRVRNTPVQKEPKTTGAVLVRLQPRDTVKWLEQSKENPRFHKVETSAGKIGYVWYQNLSTTEPKPEVVIESGKAKNVDAQAFASYGAAARGLRDGPRNVSKRQDKKKTAEQFVVVEKVAEKVAKDSRRMKQHVSSAGLAAGGTP